MIGEIAIALGLGLALGIVTGLPLGVVNLAIVATAARHGARAGAAIGAGGAIADATHATVAFAGLGPVIAARPTLSAALTVASGVVLIAFAWQLVRARSASAGREEASTASRDEGASRQAGDTTNERPGDTAGEQRDTAGEQRDTAGEQRDTADEQPRDTADGSSEETRAIQRRGVVRRIGAGLALTLPNPAALAAWIAVATALGDGRSHAASAAMAIGVGVGSAAYFVGLAHVAARTSRTFSRPRWIDRGAALVVAIIGIAAIARGAWRLA